MSPNTLIADAIRRERQIAQLSLSALAAKAGLAKSTLSQLEAGRGNPNVETLWAIATALDIPFSALFEQASSQQALLRASDGVSLSTEASGFVTVLLDRCPPDRRRDLYRVALAPGAVRLAQPHPRGTLEHAFLCQGRVRLGPSEDQIEIGPGDYYRYHGDVMHCYEAIDQPALLLLVMDSPR